MPDIEGLCGLLEKHSWDPCTRIAATFKPAVGSEEDRVTLARNGLVPLLLNDNYHAHLRILAAYLLHALYDHPTQPNPFREYLFHVFQLERSKVIKDAKSPQPGRAQLVFSLWRILMGNATQLSQYSPRYLSQEYLPAQNLPATLSLLSEDSGGTYTEQQRARSHSPPVDLSPALSTSSWPLDSNSPHPPSRTSYTPSHRTPSDASFPHHQVSVTDEGASGNIHMYGGSIIPPAVTPYNPPFDGVKSELALDQQSGFGKQPFAPQGELPSQIHQYQRVTPAPPVYRRSPHATVSNLPILYGTSKSFDTDSRQVHDGLGSTPGHFSGFDMSQIPGVTRLPSLNAGQQHFWMSEQNDISPTNMGKMFVTPTNLPAHIQPAGAPGDQSIGHAPALHHESSPLGYHRPRPSPIVATGAEASYKASSMVGGLSDEPLSTSHDPFLPSSVVSPSSQIPPYSAGVIGSGRPAARNLASASSSDRYNDSLNRRDISSSDHFSRHPYLIPPSSLSDMHPIEQELVRRNDQEPTRRFSEEPDSVSYTPFSMTAQLHVPSSSNPPSYSLYKKLPSHINDSHPLQPAEIIPALPQKSHPSYTSTVGTLRPQSDLNITEELGRLSLAQNNTKMPEAIPLLNSTQMSRSSFMTSDSAGLQQLNERATSYTHVLRDQNLQHTVRLKNEERDLSDSSKQLEIAAIQGDAQASELSFEKHLPEDRSTKVWQEFTKAIRLFIDARDRVLTLTERRLLQPHLLAMTRPVCILRPSDISSLVMKNPDLAIKLLVVLLDNDDVRDTGQDSGDDKNAVFNNERLSTDGVAEAKPNGYLSAEDVAQIMTEAAEDPASARVQTRLTPLPQRKDYLGALGHLPPTRQSFDVIGGLLKPAITCKDRTDSAEVRVASIIRVEVLGEFIAGCVRWIEVAENEERQGELFDDRVAIATGNLCRFYLSLLNNGFLSIDSEVDTAEMISFALQFSKFDEARQLYSHIAEARA